MLWDAVMDALREGSLEVKASVDATFSWYFRDEDKWLTVESRKGEVAVRPGLTDQAEMKFYSASVADFIHQHSTEGAGRAIFQGGGFYWRGNMDLLKAISPLCRALFGVRLHQRLQGAGIQIPRFEARRYPARTKAQRDRILAEWVVQGERHRATEGEAPPGPAVPPPAVQTEEEPKGSSRSAGTAGAAGLVPTPAATPVPTSTARARAKSAPRKCAPSLGGAGTMAPTSATNLMAPVSPPTRGVKTQATPRSAKTLRKG